MKIKCPACSAVLSIPDSAAGKVVKCPCGKQLRAPGGAVAATGAPGAPARPATPKAPAQARPAIATPPAARPAATGGFDASMFDELTAKDLKPVTAVGRPMAAKAAPTPGGGKLMQQYAPPSGRGSGPSFQRGPIASPWVRLGAAIIDGFVIGFIAMPIVFGGMFLLVPLLVDVEALKDAENMAQAQRDAAAAALAGGLMAAYLISLAVAYTIPITIYAIMVTKSGQTPGKKLCGIRILNGQTGELPGFVKGVLVRSWVFNVVYCVPLLGAIFALVDQMMIFGSERKCLHDQAAGTIVVES